MPVFQLPPEMLRVGHPTPFALRDKIGNLLVARGMMVASEDQRQQLISRELYVDEHEGEALRRAIAGKLDSMVRQNALIGQIAQARADVNCLSTTARRRRLTDPTGVWSGLRLRTSALLRDPTQPEFAQRADQVQRALLESLDSDPDVALLLLVQATSTEARDYSVTHALLVAVVCELAAREVPGWTADWRSSLRCAALTMNVAMTALQNQLALQDGPVSPQQRAQIDAHAARGATLLREAGVGDPLWLGAVEHHHASAPGSLADLPPERQLARLLQRADIFAARLSPRKLRRSMSATAAAKAAYLDEKNEPDEAGSAIIKATGIYPPGSLVRLGSGEVAVVLRRGQRANEPSVVSVVSASGAPLGEPIPRNTHLKPHDITSGVAPHEVKLRLDVERLVRMA
jgi:HD-GYP domain-containing protein (c-di-GMP phosphodiesterase class II)